jgi:hypothetical protein
MKKFRVLICEVDERDEDQMREVASFEIAGPVLAELMPGQSLDELESRTAQVGQQVLKRLLEVQWDALDEQVAQAERHDFPPCGGGL